MKGANLYLLDYFTTGVILNETREWILKTKFKKVIFEEYYGLITFININKNHWRFVMAKQVVEEFPKIPDIINITPSTEMMSHYRKSVTKEILLASDSM
ncbi:hypothetical protein G5714_004558 [Onychostoma macrolepis]|uniref:Uncharacterized protein n=1 Tax=Onychostoma macrolepis TaxID=369639 RepID=A0A7J6D5I2_9TELE|nr:hypothetical protein G5714_004558 [Onychostoma macrolepis]